MTRTTLVLSMALSALAACGSTPPRSEPPDTSAPVEPSTEIAVDCSALTRGACLSSLGCELDHLGGERYACRPERGRCEEGYSQQAPYEMSPAASLCEQRAGCTFVPMHACYCACRGYGATSVPDGAEAPECDCECTGGAPGGCVPAT